MGYGDTSYIVLGRHTYIDLLSRPLMNDEILGLAFM